MATIEQNDWVARVLGVGANTSPGVPEGESLDLAALGLDTSDLWQGAVQTFQNAVEAVDGQISELQATLRDSDDPELHEIAEFGLNGVTGNTRVPLMAAMREAGDGGAAQLTAAKPKLTRAIDAFRKQLASEPRIAACDTNPFDVPVAIQSTYEDALDQLENVLKRAA